MARTGYQVKYSLANDVPAMGGADYNVYTGEKQLKTSKYITAVPREEANLEAEGGETVFGDLNGDGMPESKIIKGPRHNGKKPGGVPLNLPNDTYIYSDFREMNIKDPKILAMFGKTGKNRGYTPADLDKQYDIMKYRAILQDPNSDDIDVKTAELMIKNYTLKKGALALAAEASKGFPQGIPAVAKPYMDANGIKETDLIPEQLSTLSQQVDAQLKSQNKQAEDETDESFSEYDAAQDINQGQPVAQPTMAQYGMTMGGYDMPFTDDAGTDYSIPAAAYGMSMGVNSNNYQGRTRSIPGSGPVYPFETRRVPVRAYGGELNTYQDTGTVKESENKPIDVTGKTDAEIYRLMWDAKQKDPKTQPVFTRNGKKLKYKEAPEFKGDEAGKKVTEEELKSLNIKDTPSNRAAAAQHLLLKKELSDPKSKVRAEYIKQTRESLNDPNAYGKKRGKELQDRFKTNAPKDDDIINSILNINKRTHMLAANGFDARMFNNMGTGLDTPEELVKAGVFKSVDEAKKAIADYKSKGWTDKDKVISSIGAEPLGKDTDIALEQATTHGYRRMQNNLSTGAYKNDPDANYALSGFLGDPKREMNEGRSDEKDIYGGKGSNISPIDAVAGNTTLAQKQSSGMQMGTFEEEQAAASAPTKKCPVCEKSDGTKVLLTVDPNTGECYPCEEEVPVDYEKPAEWWLQDTIKTTGAFGDLMRAKKYMPWAPTAKLETPKASFLDPTRELAAQSEQANIQTQALGQFAGPQGLSARSSSIQGQAAKQAADTLSRYNNANVNLANQFETGNINIRNQNQADNRATKKELFNANTIANQQFDNTTGALRGNFRNQYANAITNRFKTDALNQMYPQYAVSPGVGGQLQFTQGKKTKPESSGKTWDELYLYYKGLGDPDPSKAADRAQRSRTTLKDDKLAAYEAQYGQAKRGGFIYADMITPFLL